jgi:sporulation protein YlmC with PRC-barrel domain
MTLSDQLQQRSDLVGTQVITRDTGKKLGVINQLWVDVDQREVVALGLRDTLFTGNQRYMLLDNIRQIGDVILVDDDRAIEDINVLSYSPLVGSEVITETGELLGKVRGFKFDPNNGEITDLIIASVGAPLIPAQLISTYELPVEEIISTGPERLIVIEGAEERLSQLTVGVLERLGIAAPPWEREDDEYVTTTTSTSNQLGSGLRTAPYEVPSRQAPVEETWEEQPYLEEPLRPVQRQYEYDYVEQSPPPQQRQYEYDYTDEPQPPRQAAYDYSYEQEDNWSNEETYTAEARYEDTEAVYGEQPKDIWDDDDYEAPEINLPQQIKAPEYEKETDY